MNFATIQPLHLALGPGVRLGSYEVIAAIGAGGMGEVYRARDTKLNRDVALKILPAAFSSDLTRRPVARLSIKRSGPGSNLCSGVSCRRRQMADLDGGIQPLWARDGSELYYLDLDGALMSVAVSRGATWSAGAPGKLFDGTYFFGGAAVTNAAGRTYDISPDGRFVRGIWDLDPGIWDFP